MASKWWSWWRLQAQFWIYRSDKSWYDKKRALDNLHNDVNVVWKMRANSGMPPKDAVSTYFKGRQ